MGQARHASATTTQATPRRDRAIRRPVLRLMPPPRIGKAIAKDRLPPPLR